jgi:hypothetical protein
MAGSDLKKILVVYYSQSGDVRSALEALTRPLLAPDFEITWLRLESSPRYPFPWKMRAFFDCMPEAVNGEPPPLEPINLDPAERFDLIVIGWQVWFLSPSLPVQAFFATPYTRLLHDTRVISVTCCRQMWQRARTRFRALVAEAGGIQTDSIVLTHQGPTVAGYLTAPRLLMTGRRDGGAFLPAAGVAHTEIENLSRFGQRLRETTELWDVTSPAPLLRGLNAVHVNVGALLPEMVGIAFMVPLGRLARRCGKPGSLTRRPVIWLFVLLLVLLLPVVLVMSAVLTPVLAKALVGRLNRFIDAVQG